jgi:hypothetical protein
VANTQGTTISILSFELKIFLNLIKKIVKPNFVSRVASSARKGKRTRRSDASHFGAERGGRHSFIQRCLRIHLVNILSLLI